MKTSVGGGWGSVIDPKDVAGAHERGSIRGVSPRRRASPKVRHQAMMAFRLVVMHSLVETCLGNAWMQAHHLSRAFDVALAAGLEHLVLELAPFARGADVALWRRDVWT